MADGPETQKPEKLTEETKMPVNSTHPDYDATLPDWLRARDVLAGEDAVKAGGEKYLPRLDSQTDEIAKRNASSPRPSPPPPPLRCGAARKEERESAQKMLGQTSPF